MYDFGSDWGIFLDIDDFAYFSIVGLTWVRGIFDTESEIISNDGTAIRGYAPTLTVFEGDLGYDVLDELVSNITNTADFTVWPHEYRVTDIQNDGTGMLTLILREEV